MKEKIYTIPLNEAFQEGGECPFCTLEKKLETEQVSYSLGASMMEPDARMLSNEKGYCRRHFDMMSRETKALSLGLVLDTHLNQLIAAIEKEKEHHEAKGGLLKKDISPLEAILEKNEQSCLICDKLHDTMEKFAQVLWYLYKRQPEFREKVLASSGFCLPHFRLLLACAHKELSGKELKEAKQEIIDLELSHLKRINEEVNWFTKKFDYRYQDEPWKNSKDAPARAMEKLAKFL